MPHMSPMQWMTMFIGTWSMLTLIIINNMNHKKLTTKKMNNSYKHKPTFWNWY